MNRYEDTSMTAKVLIDDQSRIKRALKPWWLKIFTKIRINSLKNKYLTSINKWRKNQEPRIKSQEPRIWNVTSFTLFWTTKKRKNFWSFCGWKRVRRLRGYKVKMFLNEDSGAKNLNIITWIWRSPFSSFGIA